MARLNLHQLEVFRTVARVGNITRAAEELTISRPSVYRALLYRTARRTATAGANRSIAARRRPPTMKTSSRRVSMGATALSSYARSKPIPNSRPYRSSS